MPDSFYGQDKKKETVYSGPDPGGTVYDPSRHKAAMRSSQTKRVASPEEVRKYGNVFFGVAGISLFNTVLAITGDRKVHTIGLGISRAFDYQIRKGGPVGPVLMINGLIACVFMVIGIFARGGSGIAFLLGILLYGADTVLLWQAGGATETRALIFHSLILIIMFMGYNSTRK